MIDTVRRYHVLADVDVHVHELDDKELSRDARKPIQFSPEGSSVRKVPPADLARHTRRLFAAVMRDQDTLDRWLAYEAGVCVGSAEELGGTVEPILRTIDPLVPRLPPRQRAYIERAIEVDDVDSALEMIFSATSITVLSLAVRQLPEPGPPCKAGPVVVQRLYRAAVEIRAELREIDTSRDEPWPNFHKEYGSQLRVTPRDYLEHQLALRDAIAQDDAMLDAWFRAEIAKSIAAGVLENWGYPGPNDDELFGPINARLQVQPSEPLARVTLEDRMYWCLGSVLDTVRAGVVSAAVLDEFTYAQLEGITQKA